MQLTTVEIVKPADANVIIGQAHFIKTVEDVYEGLVQAVPGIKFGLAFCEASGPCLIRHSGTDDGLEKFAIDAASAPARGSSGKLRSVPPRRIRAVSAPGHTARLRA